MRQPFPPAIEGRCSAVLPGLGVHGRARCPAFVSISGQGGLILWEGTVIGHSASRDHADVPSFYGKTVLAGWKGLIDAVHMADGLMALQRWYNKLSLRALVMPNDSLTTMKDGVTAGASP
jgi:hypothetical protein